MLAVGLYTGWGKPGGVSLWDAPAFIKREPGIQTPTGTIVSLAFSPASPNALVAGETDECVSGTCGQEKKSRPFFGHEKLIQRVAVSPDGQTIASASFDGTV